MNEFHEALRKIGVNAAPPLLGQRVQLQHPDDPAIGSSLQRAAGALDLLFIILPEANVPLYKRIKTIADKDYGIHTICSVGFKLSKDRGRDQYMANVALKFNLKLGGINQTVENKNLGIVDQNKTMVVGIDVTHPSPGSSSNAPSVSAMVASVDKFLGQWPATLRIQRARQENVDDLTEMLKSRLNLWKTKGKHIALPENILIYRDGVSEGQYDMVLSQELPQLRRACEQVYPTVDTKNGLPRFTIIICGKRHKTRFYPTTEQDCDRSGNTKPGTVVDRGGTARPCHYYIVHDEIFRQVYAKSIPPPFQNIANIVEDLTHNMCYLFGRATKAVSLCPPAYYADLAYPSKAEGYDVLHVKSDIVKALIGSENSSSYATTQGSGGYGERPARRAKRLAEAIYGQPEVSEALREHPTSGAIGIVTVKALRKEMNALEEAGGMFCSYNADHQRDKSTQASIWRREEQLEGSRKLEDERIFDDMQFGRMFEQVQTRAPLLCGLLNGLMAPKKERNDRPPRDPSKFNHRAAVITSILCYSRASEGSNKFPRVFGAFLYSNGVKRRVLDLLHQLGLCEGYKGVHKHLETGTVRRYGQQLDACVEYDNFDYREGVKHQLISNHAEMRSVTTGKVFRGADIPPGGLRKSMLHREVPLTIEDLLYSPGAAIYDETAAEIDCYFIAEAIRTAYPSSVKHIFATSDISFPTMPTVELLEIRKTDSKTLGPILFNEGTLDGSYEVVDSIYKHQFQLDDMDFNDRLFLAFGDQKTSSLIRSMQAEQVDASSAYDRKDWLIGVAALFHLRMNFLWLMQKTHYGNMEQQDASTLHHNINFWGRKNIPADRAAFQVLEELVLHSFEARVVGLLYTRLEQRGVDTSEPCGVESAIEQMKAKGFMALVEDMRKSAFEPQAWRPPKDKYANNTVDEEFLNHARYLQQMSVYKTLKYSIKNGDIGLIDRVIGVCCFTSRELDNQITHSRCYF
ncbi:hypothetical protein H633G_09939 [Metarhizium anisopliae BRIP 53284]|nr:hypothetical protein H633G_09939 [Metarhizium anisopliae BRIP 53284]